MHNSTSALAGVHVLDLSRVLAGPWSTQILGDLGADVIKVERPISGDDTRSWGPPFLVHPDGSQSDAAYYLAANRNKRSITVDFSKPEGANIIHALMPHCQILVENFKFGGLAHYGLDYDSAAKINPALVYCSITGFGQTGPYAKRAGYDYIVQAMSGLMSVTGEPEGAPMKVGVPVADLAAGMYATVSILAALRHAERTGEGQHIDISLMDAQLAMLANQASSYLTTGVSPRRLGNAHPSIAPYQPFETADGWVVLAVGNDGQFHTFCRAAGLAGVADDARFAKNADRVIHREALTALIAPVMRSAATAHWLETLEAAGVPCGPVNTVGQAFEDVQSRARGAAHAMTRSDGAAVKLVASPIRMSATPPLPREAPPALGQHTEEVLAEVLSAGPEDFRRWREAGAI